MSTALWLFLDSYYDVYVTARMTLSTVWDWIEQIYTPDMNNDYVFPNVFMSSDVPSACLT